MKPQFSLVIPVCNEEESIPQLLEQITSVFKEFDKSYEILFIDDGSTDTSLELLKTLEKNNSHIKIFAFRRNLGKSTALSLGFQEAEGEFILTLDADLQDDPSNIPVLFEYLQSHELDLVTGWRKLRKDRARTKLSSKFFNWLVSVMFGLKLNDLNSGLKLYRSDLAKELNIYGGMHRFIPVMADEMGFRVSEIPVVHHERKFGYSKYKATKIFTALPDLFTIYFLTKYTIRPLHFFSKIGVFSLVLGSILLMYLVFEKLAGHAIGNRPLLIFAVLFVIAGVQTIFTGFLADLLVNLNHKEAKRFPLKYKSHT